MTLLIFMFSITINTDRICKRVQKTPRLMLWVYAWHPTIFGPSIADCSRCGAGSCVNKSRDLGMCPQDRQITIGGGVFVKLEAGRGPRCFPFEEGQNLKDACVDR